MFDMFLPFGLHNLFILVVISSESLDQTPECADCYTLEKEEFLITDEVRMFLPPAASAQFPLLQTSYPSTAHLQPCIAATRPNPP